MIICPNCGKHLLENDFDKRRGRRASECRACGIQRSLDRELAAQRRRYEEMQDAVRRAQAVLGERE